MKLKRIAIIIVCAIVTITVLINFKTPQEKECFKGEFDTLFNGQQTLKDNGLINLNKSILCEEWDEILILGKLSHNRLMASAISRVVIPDFPYQEYVDHNFIFFIRDNRVISGVIPFGDGNFLFSHNFNRLNYIKLKRANSKFTFGFQKYKWDKNVDSIQTLTHLPR